MFIDTHCHIHDSAFYADDREAVYDRAIAADVSMLCVGTETRSSHEAVEFTKNHDRTWAIVGVHPHEANEGAGGIAELVKHESGLASSKTPQTTTHEKWVAADRLASVFDKISDFSKEGVNQSTGPASRDLRADFSLEKSNGEGVGVSKIVGIGEIGLDYFYDNAPRGQQIATLEAQLQLAVDYDLPVSFHVRGDVDDSSKDVFKDFWPIFANFSHGSRPLRGVMHSFTDSAKNLEIALSHGLFIGVNGISTFAKNTELWQQIPLEKMLLETDAPFLTPVPFRGKINEPAFVRNVAEFHASLRDLKLEHLARATSANARELFSI